MPSDTFWQLNHEKRKAILEAAWVELAKEPYKRLSVSMMIARMNISRASFYTYFHDKTDLLRCMLGYLYDEMFRDFLACMETEDGNYLETCLGIVRQMKENGKWEFYSSLCKHLFKDREYRETALFMGKSYYETGRIDAFVNACYGIRNLGRYGALEKESFGSGLMMGLDMILNVLLEFQADAAALAVKDTIVLNVARSLVLNTVIILGLPALLGGNVVWLTFGISESIVLVLAFVLRRASERNGIEYK